MHGEALFISTASWASLDIWLVGIHLIGEKVQSLSLPLLFRSMFHQDTLLVVGIGFELPSCDELMYPGFGAPQSSGRPFGIQYLHNSHEKPRVREGDA
jgi:hypothetical protein